MTRERATSFPETERGRQMIAEASLQDRTQREAIIEHARQVGQALDATLVAMTGFPPGIDANPAVYRKHADNTYFMVAGKLDEVATDNDPVEKQRYAKRLYSVPLEFIGDIAIVPFDFQNRLKEGGLFYTPQGYVTHTKYNPQSDPAIV